MALVGGQVLPLIEVRAYDVGQGDPRVTDRGYSWYHPLLADAAAARSGATSLAEGGRLAPALEILPEIGLTPRPYQVPQRTLLVQYARSGGVWGERVPETGVPRVELLHQLDNTPGVQWSATSTFALPRTFQTAFVLDLAHVPPDWDDAALPHYVRIEFGIDSEGHAQFGIEVNQDGAFLLEWDTAAGAWTWAADLPAPRGVSYGGGAAGSELLQVWVRCLRGKLGVSLDRGESYVWHESLETARVRSARFTVRGQGGQVGFGLHQLRFYAGTYTSPAQDTMTARIVATADFSDSRHAAPEGGNVVYTDLSEPLARRARYRVSITPRAHPTLAFTFYHCPVVYAPCLRYLPAALSTSGSSTVLEKVVHCRIEKPEALSEGRCTVRVRIPPGGSLPSGSWRRRKIVVRLGLSYTDENGTPQEEWWTAFTGYVGGAPTASWDSFGNCTWEFTAENATARFRHTEWWADQVLPLGGRSLNLAADRVWESEGIAGVNLPLYRAWHAYGNTFLLPAGLPEEPCELTKVRERKWETLERLFGYAGLEIGARDDGVLFSLPVSPDGSPTVTGVVHDYHATTAADLRHLIRGVSGGPDFERMATAVMVSGTNDRGQVIRRFALDREAETNPASSRFCPWRESGGDGQEELSGTTSQGMLVSRTQALAYRLFPLQRCASLAAFLNLNLSRRDEIRFHGCAEAGIADLTRFVVLSLVHTWELDAAGRPALETEIGLWNRSWT